MSDGKLSILSEAISETTAFVANGDPIVYLLIMIFILLSLSLQADDMYIANSELIEMIADRTSF